MQSISVDIITARKPERTPRQSPNHERKGPRHLNARMRVRPRKALGQAIRMKPAMIVSRTSPNEWTLPPRVMEEYVTLLQLRRRRYTSRRRVWPIIVPGVGKSPCGLQEGKQYQDLRQQFFQHGGMLYDIATSSRTKFESIWEL